MDRHWLRGFCAAVISDGLELAAQEDRQHKVSFSRHAIVADLLRRGPQIALVHTVSRKVVHYVRFGEHTEDYVRQEGRHVFRNRT